MNVHLSVHPLDGHVTLAASAARPDIAHALTPLASSPGLAASSSSSPPRQRDPKAVVERESHYLWGRRYLLSVATCDALALDHKRIVLRIRHGTDTAKSARIFYAWHKTLLHEAIPPLIQTRSFTSLRIS